MPAIGATSCGSPEELGIAIASILESFDPVLVANKVAAFTEKDDT
jgi:hypothetical protein